MHWRHIADRYTFDFPAAGLQGSSKAGTNVRVLPAEEVEQFWPVLHDLWDPCTLFRTIGPRDLFLALMAEVRQ